MAADLEDAEKLFRTGQYDACLRMVDEELDNGAWSEPWRLLKIRTELIRGKDAEALAALEDALRRFPASVQLHLLGREVYRYNGRDQDAVSALDAIERMVAASPRRFSNAPGLIALGPFLSDPRGRLEESAGSVLRSCHQAAAGLHRGPLRNGRVGIWTKKITLWPPTRSAKRQRRPLSTRGFITCLHWLCRPRIAPGPPRSWPRRSRSTLATSTVCC